MMFDQQTQNNHLMRQSRLNLVVIEVEQLTIVLDSAIGCTRHFAPHSASKQSKDSSLDTNTQFLNVFFFRGPKILRRKYMGAWPNDPKKEMKFDKDYVVVVIRSKISLPNSHGYQLMQRHIFFVVAVVGETGTRATCSLSCGLSIENKTISPLEGRTTSRP